MLVAALVSSLLASSLATARPDKHDHSGHAAQHNEVDTGEKMLWRVALGATGVPVAYQGDVYSRL